MRAHGKKFTARVLAMRWQEFGHFSSFVFRGFFEQRLCVLAEGLEYLLCPIRWMLWQPDREHAKMQRPAFNPSEFVIESPLTERGLACWAGSPTSDQCSPRSASARRLAASPSFLPFARPQPLSLPPSLPLATIDRVNERRGRIRGGIILITITINNKRPNPVTRFPLGANAHNVTMSDQSANSRDSSSSPPSTTDDEHHQILTHHQPTPLTPGSPFSSPSPTPTPHADSPLLPPNRSLSDGSAPARSPSAGYINSPLNPNPNSGGSIPRSRPASRSGSAYFSRLVSEESAAFANAGTGQRGSMLLYRLASDDDSILLQAPQKRFSIGSESVLSFGSDSKYPIGAGSAPRGMVPYVYDPGDEKELDNAEDELHRIEDPHFRFSWRGVANIGLLVGLIAALLCLFILYPVVIFVHDHARSVAIDSNIHINATGQQAVLFQMPELIDAHTPDTAKSRTGFDGQDYTLVFSDEFNTDGRTFYPGDDPFWEAMDLWYGATEDLEWYDPQNAFTRDGNLVLLIESVENHGLNYRSAMLQSWNKFCFTSGYIEVNISLPGPNDETQGYVSSPNSFNRLHCAESFLVAGYLDDGQPRTTRVRRDDRRDVAVHIRLMRRRHVPQPDVRERVRSRCSAAHRPREGQVQLRLIVVTRPTSVRLHLPRRRPPRPLRLQRPRRTRNRRPRSAKEQTRRRRQSLPIRSIRALQPRLLV